MVTVRLYGDLKQFSPDGEPFRLAVGSGAEAVKCLLTQIDGLRQHLAKGYYKVRLGKRVLSHDNLAEGLHEPLDADRTLHITPVVAGAKRGGVFNLVVGAILIAASWYAGGAAGWAYLGQAGYGMATAGFMMGASMMLSGLSQMLTKPPSMDGKLGESDKKTSSAFSNLQNLSPQNRPIPLLYGRMMVSMILISQGVETFIPEPTAEEKAVIAAEEARKTQQAKAANNVYPREYHYYENNSLDREREAQNERDARDRAEADKKSERDERRSEGRV